MGTQTRDTFIRVGSAQIYQISHLRFVDMRTYKKPQGKLSVDQQTVSGTVALQTFKKKKTGCQEESR